MGGAFGLAMCNAILNNVLQANLPRNLPAAVRDKIVHAISADLPGVVDDVTRNAVYDAYQSALHTIFLSFVPIVGVAFVSRLAARRASRADSLRRFYHCL